MKIIYFKNELALMQTAEEIDPNAKMQTVNCACGESSGYHIGDTKLILCEACYNDAPFIQRGE